MLLPEPFSQTEALIEPWRRTLARRGSDAAVLDATGAVARTFTDVEAEAERLAVSLGELPAGSVVAVRMGNSAAWPAVFLALLRTGHVTLPLGADMEAPPFAHAVIDRDLCVTRRAWVEPVHALSPKTVLLKLTSGTTGAPRAVRFTAAQLAADCAQVCDTMGLQGDDVNFGAIPVAHSYGFSNLLTPLLLRGISVALTEDRLPRALLAGLEKSEASVFAGTPIFFQHLAELEARRPPRLRLCISAGAPLTVAVWMKFRLRYGLGIHTFYGSSECGGIAYDRSGVLSEEGGVGEPMVGVKVTPAEAGSPCHIEVRSGAVGEGYFPHEEPAVLDGERFVPGDLVRLTDRGLVIAGRASDFINVAGRKLNPAEVERQLATFPGVEQAIVLGVPSRVRGEEPVVCVKGQEIDAAALLRHCAAALPAWQVPRDVWLVAELPFSERGKINRRALAEEYLNRHRAAD